MIDHDYLRHYTVKPKDVLLDLGASVGEFGRENIEEIISKNAFLVSVEPYPWCLQRLAEWHDVNIKSNGMIIGVGVGGYDRLTQFNVTTNFWCNSCKENEQPIVPAAGFDVRVDTIPMLSLDTLLRLFGDTQINFMKADIEGSELDAIGRCSPGQLCKMKNMAIAAYHIVDGAMTCGPLEAMLVESGYQVIVEDVACNGFPPYRMLYATLEGWGK